MKRCLTILALCGALAAPASAAPVLEHGSKGRQVRVLQERLGLAADGVFGKQTARAVRRFQRRKGLPVTGRVDDATRAALGLVVKRPPATTQGGAEAGELPAVAPAGDVALAMVEAARAVIGAPYKAASSGPDGFDCSGLIVYAAAQAGVTDMPRSSFLQFEIGTEVPPYEIQAGDLVFFDTAGPGPSDVGIASGPDSVISATTHGVREHTLSGPYWGDHFVGARRL